MNKLKLALIGADVSRSHSEKIHRFILDCFGCRCEYALVSCEEEKLSTEISRLLLEYDGFNVTIPYKLSVEKFLNSLKDDALRFGAVNTVVCATKTGYNTDGIGFLQALERAEFSPKGKKALIVGAGGAGRSVAIALKNAGADAYLYRRNVAELERTCAELGVKSAKRLENGYALVVNATGVGRCGTEDVSPVGAEIFVGAEYAVDLVYDPAETEFLRLARGVGTRVLNGASMLFYQAYYSDCYYLNRKPSAEEADRLYSEFEKRRKNL